MFKWITKHPRSVVAILLFIMFLLSFFSSAGTAIWGGDHPGDSGIVDEIAHIPAGYSYLKFQDFRLNPEHPPLIKDLAALPLLFVEDLTFPTDIPAWTDEINGQWECGWKFIYERGNDPEMMFLYTRFLPMLLLFLLGIYVYKWTKELFGIKAGLLATTLFAFSPNIIAHSHYVTTDFGVTVFMFISVYYFTKFIKKPGWWTMILATITFALASLAKFSAVLLIPYFGLLLLAAIIVRREQIKDFFGSKMFKSQVAKRIWIYVVVGIVIAILGHLLVVIPYVHHTAKMPTDLHERLIKESLPQDEGLGAMARPVLLEMSKWPGGKAMTTYFTGAVMVFARVGGGNSAFLLGDYQNEGWWYFYLVSFLLKVPAAMLILTFSAIGIGFVALARNWKKVRPGYVIKTKEGQEVESWGIKTQGRFGRWFEKICKLVWNRFDIFVLVTIMLMFWVAGFNSKANIGLRWMLPTFPFLYVIVAGAVLYCLRNLRKRAVTTKKAGWLDFSLFVTTALVVWYILASLFAYPYYLSYFNEFIGVNENGYKYSVDSNLDWGQDLNRLAKWMEINDIDHIYVDYFGGGVPEHSLGEGNVTAWHSKETLPPPGSYLAISATFYQMSEFFARRQNEVSYVEMLSREPDYFIDSSILIYKITEEDYEQFVTSEEAVTKAAEYLGVDAGQDGIEVTQVVITNDDPNTMSEFPDQFQRPVFVVWFTTPEGQTAVYVDKLSGEVWGGYSIEVTE